MNYLRYFLSQLGPAKAVGEMLRQHTNFLPFPVFLSLCSFF
jgi:hypothetical protein